MRRFEVLQAVVDKMTSLRRDAEESPFVCSGEGPMLERLDKKVSSIMRGDTLRVAVVSLRLSGTGYLAPAEIDPIRQSTQLLSEGA